MISIIQRPSKYSPSGNPIIWQVSSNAPNIHHFKVEVIEQSTGGIIHSGKYSPWPNLGNGSVIRLERELMNIVDWQVDNDKEQFIVPMTRTIRGYRVKITEVLRVNDLYVDGGTYNDTNDINYVFNAKLDNMSFNNYDQDDYLITSTNSGSFMTYKPQSNKVNKYSSEQLYFLQDGTSSGLKVEVNVHQKNGTLVSSNTVSVPSISQYFMYRINVSPQSVMLLTGTLPVNGQYYTVRLLNSSNQAKSETRRFDVREAECHLDLVNISWVNSIGGLDTYQFVNPQETKQNARVSIKKNTYKIISGLYKNISNGIYHPGEEHIENTPTVTVKVYTRVLSDEEVVWLGEMFDSKQVFIEMSDGSMLPIVLVNTTFNYQKSKYLDNVPNIMNFDFQYEPGHVPAIASYKVGSSVKTSFLSRERFGTFTKNDCASGTFGTQVIYTVPEGAYTSTLSQLDANAMAQADVNANGQAYANSMGTCEVTPQVGNQEQSQSFTRNNCGTGYTGTSYTYVVASNTYYAATVQDANQLALDDINANGQAAANTNGTCVVSNIGNDAKSGTFTKQGCAEGYTGSTVVYTVPANTYYAATKEAANQLATNDVNANGQAYANDEGVCQIDAVEVQIWIEVITFNRIGETEYRVKAYSSRPVNTDIIINLQGFDENMNSQALPSLTISNGSSVSATIDAATVPSGTEFFIDIQSVSPNNFGGYVYQWN